MKAVRLLCALVLFTSCSDKYAGLIDEYGMINETTSRAYFELVETSMLRPSEIDEESLLPIDIEKRVLAGLDAKNDEDYRTNIEAKNYFVVQQDPRYQLFEITVPKSTETEEGRRLWKLRMNILFRLTPEGKVDLFMLHEVSNCRFLIEKNLLHYITVDSSFGMNYTRISYLVFRLDDMHKPIVDELLYASGSGMDTTLQHWEKKDGKLVVEGFSNENKEREFRDIKKEIDFASR